jgi:hypothetical protein
MSSKEEKVGEASEEVWRTDTAFQKREGEKYSLFCLK